MASEKQIRANRENAKRSRGPKSPAGRLRSSRNALRHGLSATQSNEPSFETNQSSLTEATILDEGFHLQSASEAEFLEAQKLLMRVAKIRQNLLADIDFEAPSLEQVKHLKALERYEVRAHRQRRRAADGLYEGKPEHNNIQQNEPNLLGENVPVPDSDL